MNRKGTWMVIGLLLTVFLLLLGSLACAKPAPTSAPVQTTKPVTTQTTAPSSPPAGQYDFTYASLNPPGDIQYTESANYWAKLVEQRSSGKIKIRVVSGGALLAGDQIAEGVGKGVAHFGGLFPAYHPKLFVPDAMLGGAVWFEYAKGLNATGQVLIHSKMMEEFPKWIDDYTKQGLKALSPTPVADYAISLKWPMKSVEEFKGRKIRVSGKMLADLFASLGAAIVTMPWGEVYTALSTGVVEGATGNPRSAVGARLYEVAPYHFLYAGGPTMLATGMHIANLDMWKKLPADVQKLLSDTNREAMLWGAKEANADQEAALAEWKKGKGTIIEMSQENLDKWKKVRPDLLGSAVKELDAAGYPGKKMIERYDDLWQDYKAGRLKAE